MSASLFRPEALAHRRYAEQAGVPLPTAPPRAVLAWSLALCVAVGLVFGALCRFDRRETITGFLAPPSGVVRLLPPRPGVVVEVRVHDGDRVAAGAPLVALRTQAPDGSGADVGIAVLDALQRQAARIAEQVALAQRTADAERARLSDQADADAEALRGLRTTLGLQADRVRLAAQQVRAAQSLAASGNVSQVELQQRRDAWLSQLQAAADMGRAIAARQAALMQDRDGLAALPAEIARRVAALRADAAGVDTRIAESRANAATLLRAPVAGRISALQAQPGQPADPSMPLLAIVPEGEALQAELLLPAPAIGEIRPGQAVQVSYDAFPPARFGVFAATVREVSRTLLRPGEVGFAVTPAEPSYRVIATLARQDVPAAGQTLPLAADMTLRAGIVTERRTLLGWLLAPLRAAALGAP